ncbi:MAG: histidine triad nucleotide-binding protein [Clostridiales bacterium]|jgi:histidine triad (HIT) family protein|nr:histidine triad nucleotide-binding protein [Clostridiales bacterium]
MNECLFCKIAAGAIPAKTVYENDVVLAFHDINPQSKAHVLLIPKKHAQGLNDLNALDDGTLSALLRAAKEVARLLGIQDSGYRLVSNCGEDGRQSVQHLHFHILGGERLSDRMV